MLIFCKIILIILTTLWGLYYGWSVGVQSGELDGDGPGKPYNVFHTLFVLIVFIAHLTETLFLFEVETMLVFKLVTIVAFVAWEIFLLLAYSNGALCVFRAILGLVVLTVLLGLIVLTFAYRYLLGV